MAKLFEAIRYNTFWIVDFLKGSKIRRHYNDVKFILENFHNRDSKNRREKYLDEVLNYVIQHVPYYKPYKNFKSILDFPVVNKLLLRESMDQFISLNYRKKAGIEVKTSGSTGIPFLVFQNRDKKFRSTADTIYFGEKAGYKIGYQLFYIRAWGKIFKKSRLTSFLQNITAINVKDLDSSSLPKIIDGIEKGNSNKAFIGYSSAFREICKYLDSVKAKPFKTKAVSVIANAEPLSKPTRDAIKKYFGSHALLRYSNRENGILSQQIIDGGEGLHINWASYYVEILDLKKDIPIGYGRLGRVVVTDLFNYHMPLVRYDTGDLAIMDIDKNSFNGAPSFFKVEGRRMDTIYDTQGKVVTSTIVYELECFSEFKQFQVIQEDHKTYRIRINVDGVFKQESKITRMLNGFLGKDANIVIDYVDEIPQLSSGKRKVTLNKYKP